mmetsp:Transcript_24161/g.70792  ORF Transcript_24161/g.70792 Transcript_24161/m.70792 type:complete len:382 (+) Transcript_24161:280-1425(+)
MSSSSVRASISMADGLAMRFEPARLRRCAPDELVRGAASIVRGHGSPSSSADLSSDNSTSSPDAARAPSETPLLLCFAAIISNGLHTDTLRFAGSPVAGPGCVPPDAAPTLAGPLCGGQACASAQLQLPVAVASDRPSAPARWASPIAPDPALGPCSHATIPGKQQEPRRSPPAAVCPSSAVCPAGGSARCDARVDLVSTSMMERLRLVACIMLSDPFNVRRFSFSFCSSARACACPCRRSCSLSASDSSSPSSSIHESKNARSPSPSMRTPFGSGPCFAILSRNCTCPRSLLIDLRRASNLSRSNSICMATDTNSSTDTSPSPFASMISSHSETSSSLTSGSMHFSSIENSSLSRKPPPSASKVVKILRYSRRRCSVHLG